MLPLVILFGLGIIVDYNTKNCDINKIIAIFFNFSIVTSWNKQVIAIYCSKNSDLEFQSTGPFYPPIADFS